MTDARKPASAKSAAERMRQISGQTNLVDRLEPKRRQPTTSAQRMRAKRERDAAKKARQESERSVLGEIADKLVDAKRLEEWNADDPEAIKKAVLQAIEKLSIVTRHGA
jgi:hypothetical protein